MTPVDLLKKQYHKIIQDYLESGDSLLDRYIRLKNGEPRFLNCMSIEQAKGALLWASINPSGDQEELAEELVPFNQAWDPTTEDHYWKCLIHKIEYVIDVCGHLDLLPLHIGQEMAVRRMLFTKENTPARTLAVNLLKASQEMIEYLKPMLIVYSNASTAFLWGTKANRGIYWMGYKLEEVPDYQLKCWEKGKGSRGLYRIIGIHEQSIKDSKQTNLEGTYLLIDYQVGGRQENSSIKNEEVQQLWEWVNSGIKA